MSDASASGFAGLLRSAANRMANLDAVDLVLYLSITMLLVRPGPPEPWYVLGPTNVIAILMLLDRKLLRHPLPWLLIAGISFVGNNVINWEFSDNHKFLGTYWMLAIGASLSLPDPARWLASNGRVLIGLVFLFATVWKLSSSTYMDYSMFRFLLISDERFFALAHYLAGLEAIELKTNIGVLSTHIYSGTGSMVGTRIPLLEPESIYGFAVFLSWWTIILEGLLAVLFLIPKENKFTQWRHVALILFAITTYPPTNVIHFGWLILIMGIACCPPAATRTRMAYLGSFLFVLIFATGQIGAWLRTSILLGS